MARTLLGFTTEELLAEVSRRLGDRAELPGPMPLTVIRAQQKVHDALALLAMLSEGPNTGA